MSVRLNLKDLTTRDKEYVDKNLSYDRADNAEEMNERTNRYGAPKAPSYPPAQRNKRYKTTSAEADGCYSLEGDDLYLPFAFAHDTFELADNKKTSYGRRDGMNFVGSLRAEQERMVSECYEKLKRNKGHIVIYPHMGFGKTIMTLKMACDAKLKTCILVNRIMLVDQWMESIKTFTTARCKFLSPDTFAAAAEEADEEDYDVYIVNAVNVSKRNRDFWSTIGTLIVDEVHQMVTREISKAFFQFTPRYVMALSATPYRFDEYHKAIGWFFGKDAIGNTLNRRHVVDYVETNFVPEIIVTPKGVDWNAVLSSQAADADRNRLIVDIVTRSVRRDKRVWMILVKRVAQADALMSMFEGDVKCATLVRSQRVFDKECDVLIGTTLKIGVGFDHKPINSLCIAADVKNYFVQFLGRCMRREDTEPYVLDVVDNFPPLRRHFEGRCQEYRRHGGIVKKYVRVDE